MKILFQESWITEQDKETILVCIPKFQDIKEQAVMATLLPLHWFQ